MNSGWPPAWLSLVFRYSYRIQTRCLLPTCERRRSKLHYGKRNILGIIFGLRLVLWVIQKWSNSRVGACFAVAGVQVRLLDIKKFFSQHMSDSKAVGFIEKSNLLSIIFAVKIGLWVIQNDEFQGLLFALLSLVFQYVYWIQKSFVLPTYGRRQSRQPFWKGNLWSIIFSVKLGLCVI